MAIVGVVLAAVYMIRVFQLSMHNRGGPGERPDLGALDFGMIAPLAVVIVALGRVPAGDAASAARRRLWPRWRPARAAIDGADAQAKVGPMSVLTGRCEGRPRSTTWGSSPLFAVLGGAAIVLMAGLFPGRLVQRVLVPMV
ncbi:MAG: hypothetical protein WKF40_07700 [Thermoleophilaceae bacterium]